MVWIFIVNLEVVLRATMSDYLFSEEEEVVVLLELLDHRQEHGVHHEVQEAEVEVASSYQCLLLDLLQEVEGLF